MQKWYANSSTVSIFRVGLIWVDGKKYYRVTRIYIYLFLHDCYSLGGRATSRKLGGEEGRRDLVELK